MQITKEKHLEILSDIVSAEKFNHIKRVAEIAVGIAKAHDLDTKKAWLAGIYHDYCRQWKNDVAVKYIKENNLTLDEEKGILLLHGQIAAHYLKKEGLISDNDILDAISSHTLGAKDMSDLQKIIFIADVVDGARGSAVSKEIHLLAERSLDKGVIRAFERVIYFLEKKEKAKVDDEFMSNYGHLTSIYH